MEKATREFPKKNQGGIHPKKHVRIDIEVTASTAGDGSARGACNTRAFWQRERKGHLEAEHGGVNQNWEKKLQESAQKGRSLLQDKERGQIKAGAD